MIKNESQAKGIATIIAVLAIAVVVFIILNKFLRIGSGIAEGLGLKDSKEEKKNAYDIKTKVDTELRKGSESFWSPKFFQTLNVPEGITRLNQLGIDKVSKEFWDSVGYIYDTPTKGLSAVKMVSSGYQLSQVANGFSLKYGLDLLGWLQNKYDTADQREVLADILRYSSTLKQY